MNCLNGMGKSHTGKIWYRLCRVLQQPVCEFKSQVVQAMYCLQSCKCNASWTKQQTRTFLGELGGVGDLGCNSSGITKARNIELSRLYTNLCSSPLDQLVLEPVYSENCVAVANGLRRSREFYLHITLKCLPSYHSEAWLCVTHIATSICPFLAISANISIFHEQVWDEHISLPGRDRVE